jgi:hypothetical protein
LSSILLIPGSGRALDSCGKSKTNTYLVTNWHVLSMRDFFTGVNLRPDAGRPNILRALFNIQAGSFDKQQWDITIRDDNDKPLWLVHPAGASM